MCITYLRKMQGASAFLYKGRVMSRVARVASKLGTEFGKRARASNLSLSLSHSHLKKSERGSESESYKEKRVRGSPNPVRVPSRCQRQLRLTGFQQNAAWQPA